MASTALQWAMNEIKKYGTIQGCVNVQGKKESYTATTFEKAPDGSSWTITFSSKDWVKSVTLIKNNKDSYNIKSN